MKVPNHIAIIMDGNGRWGKKKFNNRLLGHAEGIKNIKYFIDFFVRYKIKNCTLYAFSRDNFLKRSEKEKKNIYNLLEKYIHEKKKYFHKNKVQINFFGELKGLPLKIKKIIKDTNKNKLKIKNLNLNIAFNYSSKLEIINSLQKIISSKVKLNERNISKNLYISESKDPDLIIRTGGYRRLSDFLLWQSSYSEIFFVKKLWPDFKILDLKLIIKKFNYTKKNYGS